MSYPSLLDQSGINRFALFILVFLMAGTASKAAKAPHPVRPDRILETRGEFSVEYSEGQETYAEQAFALLDEWAPEAESIIAKFSNLPDSDSELIIGELKERRSEYLDAIAKAIGKGEANKTMGEAYDLVLQQAEQVFKLRDKPTEDFLNAVRVKNATVWERGPLKLRLEFGESIEPFDYDADAGRLNVLFISDRFSGKGICPIIIGMEGDGQKPIDWARAVLFQGFEKIISMIDEFSQDMGEDQGAVCRHVVLHEAAEAGLGTNYLVSPDRRSALDGMAEFVTWKVVRDLDGLDEANAVYPVAEQLRENAHHQPKVDLVRWVAAENEDPEHEAYKKSGLWRAHYDFASAAFFLIAQRYGDAALTRIWNEVGKATLRKADLNTVSDACRSIVGRPMFEFYEAVETRPVEELIQELTILRELPVPFPKPELKAVDVADFPVSYDPKLEISDAVLREEIESFVQLLKEAIAKPRVADDLANFDRLKELHGIASVLSGRRQVPNVDVNAYLKAMEKYDLKNQNPKLEFRGVEFWKHADLFASMRAGNKYNALVFAPEYGRLEIGEIPAVFTRESIRVRRMAIPVDASGLAEESASNALKSLADSFDRQMAHASQRALATYASSIGFATARHNFSYIGIDQRWFHDGFAGYIAWAVLDHILGDTKNKQYWDTVSSLGKAERIKIPIEAFVSYDTEVTSLNQLRGAAQRLFLSLHANYGRETIGQWFNKLDEYQEEVKSGSITVLSLLEEVLGQSLLSVE